MCCAKASILDAAWRTLGIGAFGIAKGVFVPNVRLNKENALC